MKKVNKIIEDYNLEDFREELTLCYLEMKKLIRYTEEYVNQTIYNDCGNTRFYERLPKTRFNEDIRRIRHNLIDLSKKVEKIKYVYTGKD